MQCLRTARRAPFLKPFLFGSSGTGENVLGIPTLQLRRTRGCRPRIFAKKFAFEAKTPFSPFYPPSAIEVPPTHPYKICSFPQTNCHKLPRRTPTISVLLAARHCATQRKRQARAVRLCNCAAREQAPKASISTRSSWPHRRGSQRQVFVHGVTHRRCRSSWPKERQDLSSGHIGAVGHLNCG